MSKVTTLFHQTKTIIQLDFNGCRPGAFAPIIGEAIPVITAGPRGSALVLTLVEDVRFDPGTILEMQQFVSRVSNHLKANAIVGITGLKKVVFGGIKPLYKTPVELFDAVEPAREWLVTR